MRTKEIITDLVCFVYVSAAPPYIPLSGTDEMPQVPGPSLSPEVPFPEALEGPVLLQYELGIQRLCFLK